MAAAKRKRKRDKSAPTETPAPPPPPPIAELPEAPTWRRNLLLGVAALYLTTVWLDGVGSNLPAKLAPRPWVYFGQIAALFRWAGEKQIDYRAEGWICAEHRWEEIDVLPFFPLDAGNKENRFYRAVQFYRRDRKVMRALESYVVSRHNAREPDKRIGGVRFSSLRIPYPAPGSRIEPYERKPLASYTQDQRHDWYWTPGSKRRERCGDHDSVPHEHESAPASPSGPEDEP